MKFPGMPQKGKPVEQTVSDIINFLRASRITGMVGGRVQQTPNGTTLHVIAGKAMSKGSASPIIPPYHVALINTAAPEATPTWVVTVNPGYICERIPGAGDAIVYHLAPNHYSTLDPTALEQFPIVAGEAIYVSAEVLANGTIGVDSESDPVVLVVDADESASTHYQPKVDDGTPDGAPGTMWHKLAVLDAPETEGGPPVLRKILSGSHIAYFQELPSILTTTAAAANIGVIPQKWDDSAKAYKLRAIDTTAGQLVATTGADTVEIRGNSKDGSLAITVDGGSAQGIDWEDGLVTTEGDIAIDIVGTFPGGIWGTFEWNYTDYPGGGLNSNSMALTFENGVLTAASGTLQTGAGTEASPYVGTFNAEDTNT